ncbi:hypothetical protein RhiirC2_871426 [Rhizophagus irregularis]|uniref:Uncharacterized protein n=1 Tax=Rhizophagus irregularis TaxID=588596 RepID=A0A2N1MB73_9GLOM|nr:hypothetical protein RhiirC2_871426 [Rhizophagus irregularis]
MFLLKHFKKDYRETSLRSLLVLILVCIILGMSMNKILIVFGLRKAEPLVTLQIKNSPSIPVWSSFICGQRFTGAVAQTLKRSFSGNVATDLPQSYIQRLNTEGLAIGDWTNQTGFWPCFVFNPGNTLFFKPGEIDQIILYGVANNGPIPSSSGLLFGIFNNERNLTSVDPFISPVPSTNTYTFTSYERVDITNKFHSYFFVNQQSSTELEPLANQSLVARFRYSPDTYLVQTYTERVQYTPYDLISNVGGLTTYALAIWIILFGYDDDIKKLEQLGFDTSYDDDNNEYVALTPPPANHHNWNSFDSNVQNNHKNIQIPPSLIPGNKRSNDNLNPEEQRAQYPNVVVGQIPLEKKQKGGNSGIGNGNYQQFVNTSTNISTGFATTSPSSYPPQISQSNNLSSIPPSLQSSVINNQGKIQGPP